MSDSQIADPKTGIVSLIGAGPGDPDLLTVKGYRLLQQADVVVYDRLVSEAILALASEDAEMVYVGKQLDFHYVPQPKINQILVDKAKEGKHVVRLKGGDSFIFGRGGEEAQALVEQGVGFEVVPGITAAAGATAYAGIPLTHRDYSQSVQFITGHLKSDGKDVAWDTLTAPNTTLVFYMGLKQSGNISKNLIGSGMSADTPVAIIENGTTEKQRVLIGDIDGLAELASQAQSPALIVVGHVVTLHDELKWM
jgi:uroporphyrin-III C-methyltransferase